MSDSINDFGRINNPYADKKTEYQANVDQIEIERKFSLAKHRFGFRLIHVKLDDAIKR